jgi:hypothetical protein
MRGERLVPYKRCSRELGVFEMFCDNEAVYAMIANDSVDALYMIPYEISEPRAAKI